MSGVQSIERAFALLRALSAGPAGITDLAGRTELPKSTVSRLVAALVGEGAVEQTESGGEYRLGVELVELAQLVSPDRSLLTAARPFLIELTEVSGETSCIAVLEEGQVRYLISVLSEEEVQVRDWTGESVDWHLVPSGYILAAGLDAAELDALLALPRSASTDRSLTDLAPIRQRLAEVTQFGHVWGIGEFDEGINSVAAPVLDEQGRTVAAIHIHGPAYRFPEAGTEAALAALVADEAERLSQRLSGSG